MSPRLHILFPAWPGRRRVVDESFSAEWEAAQAHFHCHLVDHDALERGDRARVAAHIQVQPDDGGTAVYRGWMMRPDAYRTLHEVAAVHGLDLINSPEQYVSGHHLPASYGIIREVTARSVWRSADSLSDADLVALLQELGAPAAIVKDFVKSEKHHWREACFIPDTNDHAHAIAVIRRFMELRGPALEGGIVLREFVPLAPAGRHPQSGMPLGKEARTFWLDGECLAATPYWDSADLDVPVDAFRETAAAVPSRFFSMDLAQRADGRWIVLELGDGQVAGLPDALDPRTFYAALAQRLARG